MSRREQVKQALMKHGLSGWYGLADDLLALFLKEPSREGLVQILSQANIGRDDAYVEQVLIPALMAWATGQPEVRRWCSDIRWHIPEETGKPGWFCDGPVGVRFGNWIPDGWKCCPICAAPRPEGA